MAKTYEPIATSTLGSAASSITFSSIPQTYTDLRLVWNITGLSGANDPGIQFNGYTGTGYGTLFTRGNGTAVTSSKLANSTENKIYMNGYVTSTQTMYVVDIFSYANTSIYESCLFTSSGDANGSGQVSFGIGCRFMTTAITSLTCMVNSGTLNAGTNATLYGILRA